MTATNYHNSNPARRFVVGFVGWMFWRVRWLMVHGWLSPRHEALVWRDQWLSHWWGAHD